MQGMSSILSFGELATHSKFYAHSIQQTGQS